MKFYQIAAVLLLAAGVTMMRNAANNAGRGMQNGIETLQNWREGGSTASQKSAGERENAAQTDCGGEKPVFQEAEPGTGGTMTVLLRRVEIPAATIEPKETPSPKPEPEPEPTAVSDAVAAFLDAQALLCPEGLPENVAADDTALPFQYAVPVSGRNSSGFGYRIHPILNTLRFHYGTDFAACTGEPVAAFADGTVSFAGYDESYGYHIRIDHGNGWKTLYAHCSALLVQAGDGVKTGQQIAMVGETGLATGPHLHFELQKEGQYLDPIYYVKTA